MNGAELFKLCGAAILGALCVSVVKRVSPSFESPLKLALSAVFLGAAVGSAIPLFEYLSGLIDKSPLSSFRGLLFSAFGAALLCHLTAEICRECGEGGVAGFAELAGKIEILILCLPLVKEILSEVEALVA